MANLQGFQAENSACGGGVEKVPFEGLARKDRAAPPMHLLLVDDDDHIREVCRSVAEDCGMKVTDVSTAEEALEVMDMSSVDILLTDLRLPGTSGLELLKRVMQTYPDIAVVMLTQYGTIDSAVEATRMGAADYVTKPFRVEELRARLATLTPREFEVFRLMIAGLLNKQIGAELGPALRTIKKHRQRVFHKLGVLSVAELARLAQKVGIEPAATQQA